MRPRPPKTEAPRDEAVVPQSKLPGRIVLAVVYAAVAVLSVVAANQEQADSGLGLAIIGFAVLALALWLFAWRRGTWHLHDDARLVFALLGLILLTSGTPGLVTEVILTHRGTPVQVEVARLRTGAGESHDYTLVLPGGSTPLRGRLKTSLEFAVGERLTVLYDRGRFVRPMLPEDVNPDVPAAFVVVGAGILAASVPGLARRVRR